MTTSARILGIILALVVIIAPARAQHHVEYSIALSLGWDGYYEHYEQGSKGVGPISHELVEAGYGRVSGLANVGFGVNKARVDLAGTNPANPLSFEQGFASARYFDVVKFDDPKLDGTHGFFDVTLFVAGTGTTVLSDEMLVQDLEFDAFWHAVINAWVDGVEDENGGSLQSVFYAGEWYKGYDDIELTYYGDPLNTYQQTATIEFIYGEPIFLDTFLQVLTSIDNQFAEAPGTVDSMIDLGNSAYWGGITNLRDAAGNPVTDAGYSSSSGFDYRADATPIPPTGDLNGDGSVNVTDLLALIAEWGPCDAAPAPCPADLNGDGSVNVSDLLLLIANWG